MNTGNYIVIAALAGLCLCSCEETSDETRLKRREVLYHFNPMEGDCVAIFGEGAIRDISPAQALADLSENLDDLAYIGIANNAMNIDLPWPYDDIEVPVSIEKNADALRVKGTQGKIALTFTAYALNPEIAVLRLDGRFCHPMPRILKENVLANCIKNIVKKVRNARD